MIRTRTFGLWDCALRDETARNARELSAKCLREIAMRDKSSLLSCFWLRHNFTWISPKKCQQTVRTLSFFCHVLWRSSEQYFIWEVLNVSVTAAMQATLPANGKHLEKLRNPAAAAVIVESRFLNLYKKG